MAKQVAMIPDAPHFWLQNARLLLPLVQQPDAALAASLIPALSAAPAQEEITAVDIEIRQGAIASLVPAGTSHPGDVPTVDLKQGLVWPCFVDMHTHLDKGYVWYRTPNPDGTFASALDMATADKDHWTPDDVYRRMQFALRCAYAHGTKAIRTHLDAFGEAIDISLDVFLALQAEWAGRIELQAVSLVELDHFQTPEGERLANRMAEAKALLGGFPQMGPDLNSQLDRVFSLAQERGLALDFHTDESDNPDDMTLRHVATAVLRHGFEQQVVCGHCCSLAVQSPDVAAKTMELVKEAKIGVVSLPLCNIYLQDRHPGQMPRWRGVTLLHELKQLGVPVAIASDNCADPFHAYGDYDGLEVLNLSTRIAHLDRPTGDWPRANTQTAADLMGLPQAGRIGVGLPADLVLFKARTMVELLSRPQHDRVVLRRGAAIDSRPPDYSELDA